MLERPVSSGTEQFQTNKSMYPITKPVTKVEALLQTSGKSLLVPKVLMHSLYYVAGELEYITDMMDQPGVLHADFVTAKALPLSKVVEVDPSDALVSI